MVSAFFALQALSVIALFFLPIFEARSIGVLRRKRQSQFNIPLDAPSLFTCLIPGIKDFACIGKRLTIGTGAGTGLFGSQSGSRQDSLNMGYKDGAEFPFLDDLGVPFLQPEIGRSFGGSIGPDGGSLGSSTDVLGFYSRRRGGDLEFGPRSLRVGGRDRTQIMGDMFSVERGMWGVGLHFGTTTPRPWLQFSSYGNSRRTYGDRSRTQILGDMLSMERETRTHGNRQRTNGNSRRTYGNRSRTQVLGDMLSMERGRRTNGRRSSTSWNSRRPRTHPRYYTTV